MDPHYAGESPEGSGALDDHSLEQGTEPDARRQADVKVELVKTRDQRWRLRVSNTGDAPACNVTLSTEGGSNLLVHSDVRAKLPVELEPEQEIELLALIHCMTPRVQSVILRWDDESGVSHEKTVEVAI